jgi:hypothetical protein
MWSSPLGLPSKPVGLARHDEAVPDQRSVEGLALVNFLHFVTWRYRVQSSQPGYPQINTSFS